MEIYNDFPLKYTFDVASADTETFTYIDGKKTSNDNLIELGKTKPQAFFREHATVRVWAWQLSDGKHFYVTNDFDEFIYFIGLHKIKAVWFYNAKFDFAQIDYQLLTHTPPYTPVNDDTKAQTPFTYNSLHNDKGGRFSLKIWTPWKATGKGSRQLNRHTRTHNVTFYDFCNIFGGGIKNLLKEFNVVDFDGNPIRKSTMDYQGADEYALKNEDLQYLKNDTIGLYHLIRLANDTLESLTGYSIMKRKPDVMTAGGLAKKVLLSFLYPNGDAKTRVKAFQTQHPITIAQDKFFRKYKLYHGGRCLINEKMQGRLITNKPMYRYDVNSEYPFIMSQMLDIYGHGKSITLNEYNKIKNKNLICIYVIEFLEMHLKEGFVKSFLNPYTGKYESDVRIEQRFLMFEEEFNEFEKWYNITDIIINKVIVYNCRKIDGYKNFVNTFYELKKTSKKNGEKAKTMFAKLLLNSSYGKLAERIERVKCHREINEMTGAVHLVNDGEFEESATSMLSVVQGAYVTAKASIWILSHIRENAKNERIDDVFVYCDTDSIHTFKKFDNDDASNLGAFKCEGEFNAIKYIAPKCYFDAQIDTLTGKTEFIEFHTKGLSIRVVEEEFTNGKDENGNTIWKDINEIDKRFEYGQKFQPLSGMNIKGGKALIPIEKYLAKPLSSEFTFTNEGYIEV